MRLLRTLVIAVALAWAPASAQTSVHAPPAALKCPGDVIVWVNTRSGIYHFAGERYFGSTRQGKFMCEKAARAEGDRPVRNRQ
jgi:hypothetical protein